MKQRFLVASLLGMTIVLYTLFFTAPKESKVSSPITLENLIEDLHGIDFEILEYEKKYKMLSFYNRAFV